MARSKTFTEIEEATSFFPEGSSKMVQRLIARATEKEIAANRRAIEAAVSGSRDAQTFGHAANFLVARELTKALKQRGASKRQAPSVKQRAPATGGRSFHFAHSAISKVAPTGKSAGGKSAVASARAANPAGQGSAGARSKSITKSAAHMRYIERETAVEVTLGPGSPEVDQAIEAAVASGVAIEGGRERTPDMEAAGRWSSAGQGYIENPVKLANGENVIFSFGTIGDTFDERVAFWETLEEHERNEDGRVQDRLIVELPHEASPKARYDMVKAFCRQFEDRGFPYWAALHAPGKDNDDRNYHAHIVYSTRPAKRMVDPSDGVEKWDFAVVETYRTSSRNTKTKHPYRQNRSPEMKRSDAIPKLRRAFADAVNEVLIRDAVKDRVGEPVRYDARSYWAMGLDVVPMRSVNRIVADKLKAGKLTILDGDYTRKMIEAELREVRGRRDRRLSELDKLGRAIDQFSRNPNAKETRRGLPRDMRPSPLAKPGRKVVAKAGEQLLKARYAAYVHDVMEQSSRSTIDRIVEATNPKVIAMSQRGIKDPVKRAALPDLALAAALHAEAIEMSDAFERANAKERERLRLRVGQALNRWADTVAQPAPEASPVVKRERRRVMSRNEAGRAPQTAEPPVQAQAKAQRSEAAISHSTKSTSSATRAEVQTVVGMEAAQVQGEFANGSQGPSSPSRAMQAASVPKNPSAPALTMISSAATTRVIEPTRDFATPGSRLTTGPGDVPLRIPSVRPKLSDEGKAELRRRFDATTSGITKAMESLRSIPDVEQRMAAMDALANAPLGPMDPAMRQAAARAWSAGRDLGHDASAQGMPAASVPTTTGVAPTPRVRQPSLTEAAPPARTQPAVSDTRAHVQPKTPPQVAPSSDTSGGPTASVASGVARSGGVKAGEQRGTVVVSPHQEPMDARVPAVPPRSEISPPLPSTPVTQISLGLGAPPISARCDVMRIGEGPEEALPPAQTIAEPGRTVTGESDATAAGVGGAE